MLKQERLIKDMTKPNYAAVVQKKTQSTNLGHIALNLGSDTNFSTTQSGES